VSDFLIRGSWSELDPQTYELEQLESERQFRKLILIASESSAPRAVRAAQDSAFNNVTAEGYPAEATRWMDEAELLDYEARLAHDRRYANPRYYKGVEYANVVEALARRRCAELFSNERVSADGIYVNVQPMSGGTANNAVYHLISPGDTVMGMDLIYGGHLSHGSRANRSGKWYNSVSYGIDPETERIDYEQVRALAREHKPQLLIAGYTSYPWAVDWEQFRSIADEVGAFLLVDIAHVAGLVAAGEYASPIGIADVVSFTTNKSLCGARGACLLTTDAVLARKIDRAVFPGEQGSPRLNSMLAMAVTFKIADSDQFRALQKQIKANAVRFAQQLQEHGFCIPFGGTDTHLFNVDMKSVQGPSGAPLMGELASRILDIAGIVVNRNTIPGDKSALNPSGLRLGTTWITQRGFAEAEIDELAEQMATVLKACQPYTLPGSRGSVLDRTKVNFDVLHEVKVNVRDLAQRMGIDFEPADHGYPHNYYQDDPASGCDFAALEISGGLAQTFLQMATSNDVEALRPQESQLTSLWTGNRTTYGAMTRTAESYVLTVPAGETPRVRSWLRDLSDGYIDFGAGDLHAKLPGPVLIRDQGAVGALPAEGGDSAAADKPYFIGHESLASNDRPPLPEFTWTEPVDTSHKKTELNETHRFLGAKMVPFAGWDMPVWYSSVSEEHAAVRAAAGLFDVSHMGVWEAAGETAAAFLDSVCANDIAALGAGESLYTHFLDPDANVIDDLLVYRRASDVFLMVVNASNDDKDWAWVSGVLAGELLVDRARPWAKAFGRSGVNLRDLRAASAGNDMRLDLALQGPASRDVLFALGADDETIARVRRLKRTQLCDAIIGGFDLIVARTGYTGEPMSFELIVHPNKIVELWNRLLDVGDPFGLQPCGLAARDSTRTEAGLPLYGQEMGGELNLGVAEAGFGSYIKTHKAWFIGRTAYLAREEKRAGEVVRFRFQEKGVRMAHLGDPVVDRRGRVVGKVTSCAIDSDGYLLGQAFLETKYTQQGTVLGIFQSASAKAEKARAELNLGDRVRLHDLVEVQTRFMRKR